VMGTCAIVSRAPSGTCRVVATTADGRCRLVAACLAEQAAMPTDILAVRCGDLKIANGGVGAVPVPQPLPPALPRKLLARGTLASHRCADENRPGPTGGGCPRRGKGDNPSSPRS
jgi:hypothetical protein